MHRSIRQCLPVLLAAAAAVVSACSSSTGSHAAHTQPVRGAAGTSQAISGVQRVTLHVTDRLRFAPDMVTVHPGTIRVDIVNDGSYPHNFSVPSLHVTSATVSGDLGDQATSVTLHMARRGSYRFLCTYHASAGMRGTLVVG
jgi:plastocyanin